MLDQALLMGSARLTDLRPPMASQVRGARALVPAGAVCRAVLALVAALPSCTEPAPPGPRVVAETTPSAGSGSSAEEVPRAPDASGAARAGRLTPGDADAGARAGPDARPRDAAPDPTMQALLDALAPRSSALLAEPARYRVQILVSEVAPTGAAGHLVEHGFRVGAEYVYPASAIKPLVAAAALRQLERIAEQSDRPVSVDTPLRFGIGRSSACTVSADPSNRAGQRITLRHEIRKMLLVSDNAAFGRLYDWVGPAALREILSGWGFSDVRIRHRMGATEADGLRAPAVEMLVGEGAPLRIEPREVDRILPPTLARDLLVGRAHRDDRGVLRSGPRDFGDRNFASVRDLHRLLVALVRPELGQGVSLGLTEAHRRLLVETMGTAPSESPNPRYRGPRYAEERFRPLLAGIARQLDRSELDYVSKSGRAYGFMIENAYLHSRQSDRALFLTVALYADDDGVVNDDRYAYDELGAPLLEDLGEAVATTWLRARASRLKPKGPP